MESTDPVSSFDMYGTDNWLSYGYTKRIQYVYAKATDRDQKPLFLVSLHFIVQHCKIKSPATSKSSFLKEFSLAWD